MTTLDKNLSLPTQYLQYLEFERRVSPLTLANYRRDLTLLQNIYPDSLLVLDQQHISRAIAQLHRKGLSGRSLARILSCWRHFYRFTLKVRVLAHNPCLGIRAPKSPKSLPQTLPLSASQVLLQFIPQKPIEFRDKAVMELFYSSGLRLAELTQLTLEQINLTEQLVTVMGKGQKTRIVPVGQMAIQAIKDWLNVKPQKTSTLFTTLQGNPLTPRAVQLRLAYWGRKQGLNERLYPHRLRHSFASDVLQSSGDLRAVQEMLGHASISSTQIYTHLDYQQLAVVYDKTHPRAHHADVPPKKTPIKPT
ncbi:MAG: tyrosine recombinase XerC [Ferrovum sp.]|nr:tyrosine recombinase XerC [Ferrovum sp.]